jgi:hypothetical protein
MSLPDPAKALADVPGALHVAVLDGDGVRRDGVLVSSVETGGQTEYGPVLHQEGDSLYLAAPFECGATVTVGGVGRRVRSKSAGPVFVRLLLGEEL